MEAVLSVFREGVGAAHQTAQEYPQYASMRVRLLEEEMRIQVDGDSHGNKVEMRERLLDMVRRCPHLEKERPLFVNREDRTRLRLFLAFNISDPLKQAHQDSTRGYYSRYLPE